jgi:coenzyme F420-reducing hydrogenase beta subunit
VICPQGIAFFMIIRLPCSIHAVRSVTYLTGVLIRKKQKYNLSVLCAFAVQVHNLMFWKKLRNLSSEAPAKVVSVRYVV